MKSVEKVIYFAQKKKAKKWFNDICKKIIREHNETRVKAIHASIPQNTKDLENKRREVTTLIREKQKKSSLKILYTSSTNPENFSNGAKQSKVDLYQLHK